MWLAVRGRKNHLHFCIFACSSSSVVRKAFLTAAARFSMLAKTRLQLIIAVFSLAE
jgi:hypothetical protein